MTLRVPENNAMALGALGVVALLCLGSFAIGPALSKAEWSSAWGSWFGRAANLATAGAALWIAGGQRRDRKAELEADYRSARELAAYRLWAALLACHVRLGDSDTDGWRAGIGSQLRAPTNHRKLDRVIVLADEFALSDLKFLPELAQGAVQLDMLGRRYNRECLVFEREEYGVVKQDHDLHAAILNGRELGMLGIVTALQERLRPYIESLELRAQNAAEPVRTTFRPNTGQGSPTAAAPVKPA